MQLPSMLGKFPVHAIFYFLHSTIEIVIHIYFNAKNEWANVIANVQFFILN